MGRRNKGRPVGLADLVPITGPRDPSAAVEIAYAGAGDAPAVTDLRTALAAYGKTPVLSCVPRRERPLFVLDRTARADSGAYVRNPEPIPFAVPSWRVGDDAWFFPPRADAPVRGRIAAVSLATAKRPDVLVTVDAADGTGTRTYPDVPTWALFPDAASARAAALGKPRAPKNANVESEGGNQSP